MLSRPQHPVVRHHLPFPGATFLPFTAADPHPSLSPRPSVPHLSLLQIANQSTPETVERDAEYAASQREIQIKAEIEKEYKKSKEYADELAVKAKAKGHEVEEDLKDAEKYAKKKATEAESYLRKEGKEAKAFLEKEGKDAKAFAKKEGAAAKKEAVSVSPSHSGIHIGQFE